MSKYTGSDFANARFAEHEDGWIAMRDNPGSPEPWTVERGFDKEAADDLYMKVFGWVPVPTKPTITESDLHRLTRNASDKYARGVNAGLLLAGAEVIPDPEPTNTDRLEQLIRESGFGITYAGEHVDAREFAEHLNDDNVTAPNVKDN